MAHKACRIDYVPLGVIGAIVPWNYPFHNVFQHLVAAILSGNALVVKASEHVAWSARYYQAIIDAALEATGAPAGLAQIITGAQRSGSFCGLALSFYRKSGSGVCGVIHLHATLRALAVCPIVGRDAIAKAGAGAQQRVLPAAPCRERGKRLTAQLKS